MKTNTWILGLMLLCAAFALLLLIHLAFLLGGRSPS